MVNSPIYFPQLRHPRLGSGWGARDPQKNKCEKCSRLQDHISKYIFFRNRHKNIFQMERKLNSFFTQNNLFTYMFVKEVLVPKCSLCHSVNGNIQYFLNFTLYNKYQYILTYIRIQEVLAAKCSLDHSVHEYAQHIQPVVDSY